MPVKQTITREVSTQLQNHSRRVSGTTSHTNLLLLRHFRICMTENVDHHILTSAYADIKTSIQIFNFSSVACSLTLF